MRCLDVFGMNEVASTFVFCQRMVISSREPNGTAEVLTVESTGAQLVPVVYWELCWFFTANLLGRRRMDTPSYRACGLATRNDKPRRTHCFAVPQEVKGSNWWPWDTMSLEFDFLVMTCYDKMTINHMQLPQVLPFFELAHEPHIGRLHHRGSIARHKDQ